MRKTISSINESGLITDNGTLADYINTLTEVKKSLSEVDTNLLDKAISELKEDSKKNRPMIDTRYSNTDIYSLSSNITKATKSVDLALDVLTGTKNLKSLWELEWIRDLSFNRVSCHLSKPPKKWLDYVNEINKAIEACQSYRNLLYNSRGSDSDLVNTIKQTIKSGGMYQETLNDLNHICSIVDNNSEHKISSYPDGRFEVTFNPNDLRDRGNNSSSKVEKLIKGTLKNHPDDYAEIDLSSVYCVSSGRDKGDYKVIFKVLFEKVPKKEIIPADYEEPKEEIDTDKFKVSKTDIKKMSEYLAKGSNPKALANTVKDVNKAISRYYIAIAAGWTECADEFYRRCLELEVSEDTLQAFKLKALNDKSIDLHEEQKTTSTRKIISAEEPKDDLKMNIPDAGEGIPFIV